MLRLLEVDELCASELLMLFSFSVDLLFVLPEGLSWILSDTEPTTCELLSDADPSLFLKLKKQPKLIHFHYLFLYFQQ